MVYILLYNKGSQNEGIHTIDYDEYTQLLFFEVESAAIAYAEKLVAKNFPKPSVELISRIEIEDFCKKEGYEPKFVPADFLPHNEKDYLMVEPPEKNADISLARLPSQLATAVQPMELRPDNSAKPMYGERMDSYDILINKLLKCPKGEENKIFEEHRDLLDDELLEFLQSSGEVWRWAGYNDMATSLENFSQLIRAFIQKMSLRQEIYSIERLQHYVNLIEQLLECQAEEQQKILAMHSDLLDQGFVHMCEQAAEMLFEEQNQKAATLLMNLAGDLQVTLPAASSPSRRSKKQKAFLIRLLQTVTESDGDSAEDYLMDDPPGRNIVYILKYNAGAFNEEIHSLDNDNRTQVLVFELESAATRYADILEEKDFSKPSAEAIARIEIEDICRNAGYELKFVPADFVTLNEEDYLIVEPPARNSDICQERLLHQRGHVVNPIECQQYNSAKPTHRERMAAYDILITNLLQCPNGEQSKILSENRELLDEELVEYLQMAGETLRWAGCNDAATCRESIALQIGVFTRDGNLRQLPQSKERLQACANLIQQLLACHAGEQPKIMADHIDLLDQDFVLMCEQEAETLLEQNNKKAAALLMNLAADLQGILTTSSSQSPLSKEQEVFLIRLLETIAESNGNPATVYPLLRAHLPLLNTRLATLLKSWFDVKYQQETEDQKERLAAVMKDLGNLLQEFPLGSCRSRLQIIIIAYNCALRIYSEQELPKAWASTNYNLGNAYSALSALLANPSQHIQAAIKAYENALRVFTEQEIPHAYANTNYNLGNACHKLVPFDANPCEQIEKAIAAYTNALRIYTEEGHPLDWARTNNNLGLAYKDLETFSANPKQEVEKAIAAFHKALRTRTEQQQPLGWALTNYNLGNAYFALSFFSAKPSEDIQKAIAAYTNCLRIYSEERQPVGWAHANKNLGNAYSSFGTHLANPSKQFQAAIEAYENALRVFTEQDLPRECAITNYALGIAYSMSGPLAARPCEKIQKAISAYIRTLRIYSEEKQPLEWARVNNYLGNAYGELAILSQNSREEIERSIVCYHNALRIITRHKLPEVWAEINNNLGVAYLNLGPLSHNAHEQIENAIDAFRKTLRVYTKDDQLQAWATTTNNLGSAYCNLAPFSDNPRDQIIKVISIYHNVLRAIKEEELPQVWADTNHNLGAAYNALAPFSPNPRQQIENAIASYRNALRVRTEGEWPKKWALTIHNLGAAYDALVPFSTNPREQIENAIAAYRNSLRVRTEKELPQDWADTNNNLGIAYRALAPFSANPREQIENAIAAYTNALQVRTEKGFPQDWGTTNNNLGNAYSALAPFSANPREQIENAIAAYTNALQVRTEKGFPQYWATTNNNLGAAYLTLAPFYANQAEQIENAIDAFRNALRSITEAEQPQAWARTNTNLGSAYINLAPFSANPREQIENAIAAHRNALGVYTEEELPQAWACTNNNLGYAYSTLTPFSANPLEQIENAIAAYRNALRVMDPVQRPANCLRTARNLGNLGFTDKLPDVAIEGYLLAITAVENLRSEAIDPARKAEIVSQAIEVYANLVQVYVDQQNYDQALEVVDRSKARNLVELLSSKDLYPKGEIPPEVIQRLDELRGSIARAERELNRTQPSGGLARSPMAGSDGIAGPEGARSLDFERIQQERTQKVGERLLQLKQELDRLIRDQIQPIDPSFSLSQKVQPLTIDQLRATLPDGQTAIVSWYVTGPQLLAFILCRDALQPICHRYPEPTLEALIAAMNAYLSAYRSENNAWQASLPAALDRFSRLLELEALVEKIQHVAPGADQLILIPHRFLHLLPLHAMPLGEALTPLQDHFSRGVRYAPSLQVLQVVQQRQPTPPHSLFALQNPTQDLLYSDLEVEAIQSLFAAKATVLKRSEASKGAMEQQKGALTNSACLHFACHGYFNFEQPLLSALLLAGSVLDAAPDDFDADRHLPQPDGSVIDLSECLTLLDLFQLDLRQARLVALSACETGLSDLNSLSDEVVGLSSGFLYAGCNNVIGSLWSVPDISTGLLMAQFYRLLMAQTCQGQPGDVPLALKQAQHWLRTLTFDDLSAQRSTIAEAMRDNFEHDLKWLKQKAADSGDNYPFRNPYYWAAFTAVGQ